jgi:hypothetical protein
VSALANPSVGEYLNRHFVSGFQKVATFKINGGQKQGGNVASYFCTPAGHVLHVVAGPVNGGAFLREARWANDTYNLALLENQKTVPQLRAFFRRAHLERLHNEHRLAVAADRLPKSDLSRKGLGLLLDRNLHLGLQNQGRVHLLLAASPLARMDQIYQVVFEKILNERVTTNPVAVAGR